MCFAIRSLICSFPYLFIDVVYYCSSAPELVGLLSELDKSLRQLKQVKPFLSEVSGLYNKFIVPSNPKVKANQEKADK